MDCLTGISSKVLAVLAAAGVLAGSGAVVQSRINAASAMTVAAETKELDARQRVDHDALIELKKDVSYVRQAIDKLLDHEHIERPRPR